MEEELVIILIFLVRLIKYGESKLMAMEFLGLMEKKSKRRRRVARDKVENKSL